MADALAETLDARTAPAAVPVCFHCGLPVPRGFSRCVTVLGHSREMCCAGCEAVTRTIVEAGFEAYYETRDASQPGEALPDALPALSLYG